MWNAPAALTPSCFLLPSAASLCLSLHWFWAQTMTRQQRLSGLVSWQKTGMSHMRYWVLWVILMLRQDITAGKKAFTGSISCSGRPVISSGLLDGDFSFKWFECIKAYRVHGSQVPTGAVVHVSSCLNAFLRVQAARCEQQIH